MKCYICDYELEKDAKIEKYNGKKVHVDCCKTRRQENENFDKLCKYIHSQIMNYDENMKISKFIVMRIKGLQNGIFYANKNTKSQGYYSYEEISLTFKAKQIDILDAISKKEFKDDQSKFNYVMAIVESYINEISQRLKKVNETNEKNNKLNIENLNTETTHVKQSQKKELPEKIKKKLDNLW